MIGASGSGVRKWQRPTTEREVFKYCRTKPIAAVQNDMAIQTKLTVKSSRIALSITEMPLAWTMSIIR